MEGLSLICAGLGAIEEDDDGNRIGYSKGEYCLDNLKDLLRSLRRDDPQTRDVFKQICKWNIVGKDLMPILDYCHDDRNLVLNAVKVLVFLTMPIEPSTTAIAQQIEYLWGVKSAITFSSSIPVILSLLEKPLENLDRQVHTLVPHNIILHYPDILLPIKINLKSESFTEDDWKLVQLVLTLFRNLLAIQEISTQQKAGGSATEYLSVRDRFLELLFEENVMEVLLALTQSIGGSYRYFRQDNFLLLETFHYIFMGQEPELIARTLLENCKEDESAETSLQGLNYIMQEEQEKRKLNRQRNMGSYSHFGGTFTRFTLDGSKTLCQGNPSFRPSDAMLKASKNHRGPSKRTVWDHGRLPSMKNKTLRLLHDFINQFLSGGYNVLMQSIREDIEKEHHAIQNSDVVVFFQVAWFVTSFQYYKFLNEKSGDEVKDTPIDHLTDSTLFSGSICGPIAETLNESMFLVLISKWRYAFDALKETNDYTLLSAAGSLLKIMIRQLDLVLKKSPEDSMEPKTARVLLYKLFYDQTDEGMTQSLLNMIKSFDVHKQAKSDLADLVETIHVIFRLMENLQTRGALRVTRRSRRKTMKKDLVDGSLNKDVASQNEVPGPGNKQSEDVSTVEERLAGHDSGCNVNEDPSQDSAHIEVGTETQNLRSNFQEAEKEDPREFNHDADSSSGDEQQAITDEVDFRMHTIVSTLGNHNIMNNLCWLLKFYKSNSLSTNHYIICLLRRICEDLELSPMLYQLSFLIIFYDILEEQKSKPCREHQNIVSFLTTLIRRMLRKMKKRPLLFVEVLFWKTRKECHLISAECMLNELGSLKKDIGEGGLNGETALSGGQGWVRRSIADALGDDEADFTMLHREVEDKDENPSETHFNALDINDGTKSALSSTDNDVNEKENYTRGASRVKKVSEASFKKRKSRVLNQEMEGKIRVLYEKYKNHDNCSDLISNALEVDGSEVPPNQVSRTLKKLGLQLIKKKRQSAYPDQVGDSNNNLDGSHSSKKPSHIRKRVRAFSEVQEQRIKDLFEQFKDHKRCSHMIAEALDAEGGISARQVTYKLKQLGLSVSTKKRSEKGFQLRDSSEDSEGGADDSDDEALISLKTRSKKQKVTELAQTQNQETAINLSEDESPSPVHLNAFEQSAGVEESETEHAAAAAGNTGSADPEGFTSGKPSDSASLEEADDMEMQTKVVHDRLADELADYDDEISVVGSEIRAPSLRRRMIMDLDDDDEE
ncbi:OLC1v1027545C1 [Oldenlandia corymbosa var. corymbosa]|uniref:OLC1v1027545C1 n=1 Tax=Oldenlandia corymbosa var. corymbosa TaxID=529605 RepID=A0AAV1CAX6_OLDCO|nr:OLC1v1027545C1 [Oldenlandia corymbosa var. corymbosa]